MQWYDHLYMGKKARRHRYAIIQGIREEKLQPEVYVITSPQNGENLCDIYPSVMLLTPAEKKKERMILLASQLYTLGYAVEDARAELQRLSQSDDTAALEDAIRRFQAASERWSAMEEEYLALRDA